MVHAYLDSRGTHLRDHYAGHDCPLWSLGPKVRALEKAPIVDLALETRERGDLSNVKTPSTPSLSSDEADNVPTIVTRRWVPLRRQRV